MGKNIGLELAILLGMLSIPADLLKEFSRANNSNAYNPNFNPRNVKKINNLKYARAPYTKNLSFYQRKTY